MAVSQCYQPAKLTRVIGRSGKKHICATAGHAKNPIRIAAYAVDGGGLRLLMRNITIIEGVELAPRARKESKMIEENIKFGCLLVAIGLVCVCFLLMISAFETPSSDGNTVVLNVGEIVQDIGVLVALNIQAIGLVLAVIALLVAVVLK